MSKINLDDQTKQDIYLVLEALQIFAPDEDLINDEGLSAVDIHSAMERLGSKVDGCFGIL